MKSKENKTRPSTFSSRAFGDSRHNAYPLASAPPQLHALRPGLPPCTCHDCNHIRHLFPDVRRADDSSSYLRSTIATGSQAQEAQSMMSNGATPASAGTSSHYSGYNSAVYGSQVNHPAEPLGQIHELLQATSAFLIWDARTEPKELPVSRLLSQTVVPHVLSFPLTSTAPGHLRIISPDFPWEIVIGPKPHGITCSEVLHAIYGLLCKELEDNLWQIAGDRKRSSIIQAWKARSDLGSRLRRVDWLGKRYMFKGLYRDSKFVQQNLRPDINSADIPETLLVTFDKT